MAGANVALIDTTPSVHYGWRNLMEDCMDYLDQLTDPEKRHIEVMAKSIVERRIEREKQAAIDKEQKEYINRICNGVKPKTTEQILAMNYCLAWQKAWSKTLQDWIDNGFHRVPYGRKMNNQEKKYVQIVMEVSQ